MRYQSALSFLLLNSLLIGCAPVKSTSTTPANTNHQSSYVDSNIAVFLRTAQPTSSAVFDNTPWGNNVTLLVDRTYFSASGAYCHNLTINSFSGTSQGLVCSTNRNDWYQARVLVNN